MPPPAQRRRERHSSVSLALAPADRPPLAALFLIDFDVKAGYTIVWKRSAPEGLELDNHVEYKSLPSGLHTVRSDLIYFVDGAYAGLSAFVNEPCDEEDARNARMIAVGILVPLSYGRLGRAWRHADGLKDMAAKLAKDRNMTEVLEKYWDANRAREGQYDTSPDLPASPTLGRTSHGRKHSTSDAVAPHPSEHRLSPHHPAWSLTKLLDRFGPLIFPIHRAALLRRRILISCHAPVHEICDFAYDISILSNIPHAVADSLPPSAPGPRLRPLFTIGVHDIPFLVHDAEASKRKSEGAGDQDGEAGSGWIACTTDSILAMKDTLWDMLVAMPPEHAANARDKVWPSVECPRGAPVKATQRDLRRYNALRAGLARLAAAAAAAAPDSPGSEASSAPAAAGPDEVVDGLVEPPSWAALAYNGYMWWASAGEQLRAEELEESSRDAALLADLAPAPPSPAPAPARPPSRSDPLVDSVSSLGAAGRRPADADEARVELAIIAYFHRLTAQMLSVLAGLVDAADEAYPPRSSSSSSSSRRHAAAAAATADDADDEGDVSADGDEACALLGDGGDDDDDDDDDDDAPAVAVDSRCVEGMGLDVWSPADARFVHDLALAYFGRAARVEAKGVEVCGVRVC